MFIYNDCRHVYLVLLVLPVLLLVSCNTEQPVINYGTAWSNDESTHYHLGVDDYSYLKKDINVIKKCQKNKILDRKLDIVIPESIYEELENMI